MFKKSYNRAVLRLRISTLTPLLIRAGDAGLEPTAADLACVRTEHLSYGRTVYIPGSSLKGALRAAAEAAVRDQDFGDGITGACDPLSHGSCGKTAKVRAEQGFGGRDQDRGGHDWGGHGGGGGRRRQVDTAAIHRAHCLACRLFGSLTMQGRLSARDHFPWTDCLDAWAWPDETEDHYRPGGENHRRANRVEVRHSIAIDRITGAVKNTGLFDMEVVPVGTSFFGELALENYQLWQLGLLARGLDAFNDGFAQLGSSKSRGLGVVRLEVYSILHEQVRRRVGSAELLAAAGVGQLAAEAEIDAYGFLADATLPAVVGEERGLSRRFRAVGPEQVRPWLEAGLNALGGLI